MGSYRGSPTLEPGSWKRSYAYGYDTLPDPAGGGHTLVYYNARDDWKKGRETVGVSRLAKGFY